MNEARRTPAKPAHQSKTIWGALASALVSLAVIFGWVKPEEVGELSAAFAILFTTAFTIYGRLRASVPIGQPRQLSSYRGDKFPTWTVLILSSLLISTLSMTSGCSTWRNLSDKDKTLIRHGAKQVLLLAADQLSHRVKEIRPYHDLLRGAINVTFAEAGPRRTPEEIANKLEQRLQPLFPDEGTRKVILHQFGRALVEDLPPAGSPAADYQHRFRERMSAAFAR